MLLPEVDFKNFQNPKKAFNKRVKSIPRFESKHKNPGQKLPQSLTMTDFDKIIKRVDPK
jgi:hypothetical protein